MSTTELDDAQKKAFLGGFDLCGQRQPDGTLQAYLGEKSIVEWPQEVTICDNTYTLEQVIKGEDGYESAQYA